MCEIISCFSVFDYLPNDVKENIRCFFVKQKAPWNTETGYCVDNKDDVYVVEKYKGDSDSEDSEDDSYSMCKIISGLCQRNIEEFFEGNGYMFARSKDNVIFQYTPFDSSENGFDFNDDNYPASSHECRRDQRLYYFDNKNIVQISCGLRHWLALSSDGVLYHWQQLKSDDSSRGELFSLRANCVPFPKVIELNENLKNQIKSVFCFGYYSFVVTISGHIYEFKENGFSYYFDLNSLQRKVRDFQTNNPNKSLDQSIDRNKVIEVALYATHLDKLPYIIFRTLNGVYQYYSFRDEIYRSETDSQTFFEYFLLKYETTYKTTLLKDNQLFVHNFIHINGISENIKLLKTSETIIPNIKHFCEHFHQKTAQSFRLRKMFRVLNDLPKNIKSDVKCYYFSGWWDSIQTCAFIVINDSTVFAYGYNEHGKLGFGHNEVVVNYTRISELCGQNKGESRIIEDFFEGENCMFARNDKNQIYGWGSNQCGQLGRGIQCDENIFLKPKKIDYFDDKNIVRISCGSDHCLALSSDGMVYGWGSNKWGQSELNGDSNILTPVKIDLTKTIKYVHSYCIYKGYNSSALICTDGKVIVWGEFIGLTTEEYRILISEIATPVKKIMGYFILSECGSVYWINIEEKKLTRIETDIKFKDLHLKTICEINICALQTEECVYELFFQKTFIELNKTNFLNFYDFYLHKYKFIYKTIHITSDGFLKTKDIKLNRNFNETNDQKLLQIEDKNVFDRKFEFFYETTSKIGQGTFGVVFEVRNKLDNKIFAIKRIDLGDNLMTYSTLREVQILSELNRDFVVKYINAWIEVKLIDGQFVNYAYIQMELCSQSLREVINSSKKISDERFKTIKYYISCELFRELIECVEYLHSLTPPIIHRDLKPENVLISDGRDGRFIKLCDFGLAKEFTEEDNHTRDVMGTRKYTAPEVIDSNNYDLRSDVYSLSVIAIELFDIKHSVKEIRKKRVSSCCGHYDELLDMLAYCFAKDYKQRPDCIDLLNRMREWTVEIPTPQSCDNFCDFIVVLKSSEKQFYTNILSQHMNYILFH